MDATIQLRTGCHHLEKHGPQAVAVHVDAWAPIEAIHNPHSIDEVINYEVIFLAIRKLEDNGHCECLESSILELMAAIFSIAPVSAATVKMQKPHVYKGQAIPAITLSLTREQWLRHAR
ncbi:dihydroneopterin aldolase [Azonexus sp.]|uniref:dihydroneopterin aldolase n=1 Tax=Azonexus sp. TaxID=1872668 RepID=UPI0039E44756